MSSVVRMSVHRALAELKLYEKKIETLRSEPYVLANKQSNTNIGGKTVEQAVNSIKANFQSMKDLLENRKRVKDAIIKSNSATVVTVAGKKMTVAEAIERKSAIKLDRLFLNALEDQYLFSSRAVEAQNAKVAENLSGFLEKTLGEKRTSEDVASMTATYEKANKFVLIDPNHIQDFIINLRNEIEEFSSQVDYILSESNATTFVEVDLE